MKRVIAQKKEIETSEDEYVVPLITPEMVASMPIEDIEAGLLQMGLNPSDPLPEEIQKLISSRTVFR